MPENTIYEENVTTEENAVAKPKKDLSSAVGIGAVAVGAVGVFEGLKWVTKKAKKGVVKLANKIENERDSEANEAESAAEGNDSEK